MKKSATVRNRALGAVHIEFARMRRDLDKEELRPALHQYAAEVLNLSSVESMADLTDRELGWVLDAMRKEMSVKKDAGVQVAAPAGKVVRGKFGRGGSDSKSQIGNLKEGEEGHAGSVRPQEAEITHLASEAQTRTIAKLFDFLRWDHLGKREEWLIKKFKVKSAKLLEYKKAHSCIRVLMNIAAHRALKRMAPEKPVSRAAINAWIPELKRRLEIQ
jgi:hypothetical protein